MRSRSWPTVSARPSGIWPALAALVWVSASLAGCRKHVERTFTDTEGRATRASCDDRGECRLLADDGSTRSDLELRRSSRAIGLCSGEADFDCRALTCRSDGDCPSLAGRTDGSCVNGLCLEPVNEITRDDAVMLCLAGTGPGRRSPAQIDRYALAVNCGSPCQVPRVCRQF